VKILPWTGNGILLACESDFPEARGCRYRAQRYHKENRVEKQRNYLQDKGKVVNDATIRSG
jgi:hypothetical protein